MSDRSARVWIVVVVVALLTGWTYLVHKVNTLEAERDRARASAQGWEAEWRTLDEADLSMTDKVGPGLTVPVMLKRLQQLPGRLKHQHEQGYEQGKLSMCERIYTGRKVIVSLEDGGQLSYRGCVRGIANFRGPIPALPLST
jgi:hypothetical protein